MEKKFKLLLCVLGSFAMFWLGMTTSASATSYQVNYTIEKYGTSQTSVADAYFAKPATVTVGTNQYTVQMTVKTNHSLGSFPVQILNVNGQTPQVQKQTSGDNDYYTFTFNTATVRKSLSGNMKVDINNINYHHYYGFNIALDASQVPELSAAKTVSQSAASPSSANNSSTSTTTAANNSNAASAKTGSSTAVSNSTRSSSSNSNSSSSVKADSSSTTSSSSNASSNSTASDSKKKESRAASKKGAAAKNNKEGSTSKQNTKPKNQQKKNNSVLGKAALTLVIIGGLGIGAWGVVHNYRG
ncbi:MAG: NEAT domain-containing protein [Liquorilactobacillus ghanensis]|uniref:NEAT domain-containing protein n=1 Tax=Liquorilactobacillus ghanensis TaxID=399370 RepID=UPI0039E737F6